MLYPLYVLAGIFSTISNAALIRDVNFGSSERDLKSCKNNIALSIVSQLKASQFCSDFLSIKTSTVTKTSTTILVIPTTTSTTTTQIFQFTALETLTTYDKFTSTSILIGPATSTTVTSTITETKVATSTLTTTVATETVTANSAIADNNLKRDLEARQNNKKFITPNQLKIFASNVVSVACSCYVPTPVTTKQAIQTISSVSVFTVVFTTIQAVAIQTRTETESRTSTFVATQTVPSSTETSVSLTTTTTFLTTMTETRPITATVTVQNAIVRTYKLQSQGSGCVYNRYTDYGYIFNGPLYTSDEQMFQYCATECVQQEDCRFFHAYKNIAGDGYVLDSVNCILDSRPYEVRYRQCNLFFAGRYLAYNLVSS